MASKDQSRVLPPVQHATGPKRKLTKEEMLREEAEHPPQYSEQEMQALRMLLDPRSDFEKFVEGIPDAGLVKQRGLLKIPGNMSKIGQEENEEFRRDRLR